MLKALILLFLLLLRRSNYSAASDAIDLVDYCNIDTMNTPCQHCTVNRRCGHFDVDYAPLNDDEKELILEAHNKIREAVAAGKHVDKNLQQASDMKAMSWDKEVEFVTSCHIKQCFWGNDQKRLSYDGVPLGQNLYQFTSHVHRYRPKYHLKEAVKMWFEEYKHLTEEHSKQMFESFKEHEATNQLTQMLWGESNLLGCCYKHFQQGKEYMYFVFCNYRPAGNVATQKLYTPGKPNCSTFSLRFRHLCGRIRPLSHDTFIVPYGAGVSVYGIFSLGLAVFCAVGIFSWSSNLRFLLN